VTRDMTDPVAQLHWEHSRNDAMAMRHGADLDSQTPTTDLGALTVRERTDRYGCRFVAFYRDGKRMTNWART
jgi:hypothetical protein